MPAKCLCSVRGASSPLRHSLGCPQLAAPGTTPGANPCSAGGAVPSAHQLGDGLAVVEQLPGAAAEVEELLLGVDAQGVVDRAEDVLGADRPAAGALAAAVGLADHLP